MVHSMRPLPFTSTQTDDLELACEIERDAQLLDGSATLERYLPTISNFSAMPAALDAAIEAAIRAMCVNNAHTALEAAGVLASRHPNLADFIHAVALGFGLSERDSESMEIDSIVFGRWRVLEILGSGATARVVRARDELLSSTSATVEVVIKRFEEDQHGDARLHAFREMRALLNAPVGLASRVVAFHAPRGRTACIVLLYEESREMHLPEDIAAAVQAVRMLHRAGIAHGDLKPPHVRLRADGSVFFIDFGQAIPATSEACRQDLVRLFEIVTQAGRPTATARLARLALTTRRNALLAGTLRCMSPRWQRYAIAGACLSLALGVAVGFGWNTWRAWTQPAHKLVALVTGDRFVDATVDADGRLVGMRLDVPEFAELFPDSAGKPIAIRSIRFHRDGSVTIFDLNGNLMSR